MRTTERLSAWLDPPPGAEDESLLVRLPPPLLPLLLLRAPSLPLLPPFVAAAASPAFLQKLRPVELWDWVVGVSMEP